MLDINTNEQVSAIYSLIEIKGGNRVEKFKSEDINEVIKYQKWYVKRYRTGLYLEYCVKK